MLSSTNLSTPRAALKVWGLTSGKLASTQRLISQHSPGLTHLPECGITPRSARPDTGFPTGTYKEFKKKKKISLFQGISIMWPTSRLKSGQDTRCRKLITISEIASLTLFHLKIIFIGGK